MRWLKDEQKPWYIWLSLVGFAFLWGDTSRRILYRQKNLINNHHQLNLWFGALGNMFLSIGSTMVIGIPFIILYDYWLDKNDLLAAIINALQWTTLYFYGVFITYKHVSWRSKHLPKSK